MLKSIQLVIALICFNSFGQTEITLTENGDSSTLLVGINDNYAYVSFTDPDNINKSINWNGNSNLSFYGNREFKPARSSLLVEYRFEKDKLILTEVFGKRYINPSVEYTSYEVTQEDRLDILFEGTAAIVDNYLNYFDSLLIEIDDTLYLGDLNTTIFSFEAKKPKRRKFKARIYDVKSRIDYEIPVKIKKDTDRIFIKFQLLESFTHSFMAQEHVKNEVPSDVVVDGKTYKLRFEFIDWMHYWQTDEVKYE